MYWAGEESVSNMRSLFMVVGLQEGACEARKGPCRMGVGTGPQGDGCQGLDQGIL